MKEEIKVFAAFTFCTFLAVLCALMIMNPGSKTTTFGSSTSGYALNTIISGSVSLGTGTSTVVSLPDTGRNFGYLCNTDSNSNEYLGFSNYTPTATSSAAAIGYATTTAGVVIFPKTCYSLDNKGNNTWAQINATTASSATTTLLYMFGR